MERTWSGLTPWLPEWWAQLRAENSLAAGLLQQRLREHFGAAFSDVSDRALNGEVAAQRDLQEALKQMLQDASDELGGFPLDLNPAPEAARKNDGLDLVAMFIGKALENPKTRPFAIIGGCLLTTLYVTDLRR